MDQATVSLIISVVAILVAIFALLQKSTAATTPSVADFSTKPLRLQAYERLVVLCERISLPNLISRVAVPGASAHDMQLLLVESIKQEFEYNASQQIYVSPQAWEAVRNLRDQNLLVINSIAKSLHQDAGANTLNKELLEVIIGQDNAALHTLTLDTLNAEAKKLM